MSCEFNVNDTKTVEIKRREFNSFNTVDIKVTDKYGVCHTICLLSDDTENIKVVSS